MVIWYTQMKIHSKPKMLVAAYLVVIVTTFVLALAASYLASHKILSFIQARPVEHALIETSKGSITIKFRDAAPKTVENFINLAQNGFYDGTRIHRVVADLLIQGGDPLTKFPSARLQWGKGGPGYEFPDEIGRGDEVKRGVVAMVNFGKDTNGSQFFIVRADAEWLNGQNTIFADVESGIEVVDTIASADIGVTGIPVEDIMINSITVW